MDTILSHTTALQYWRHKPADARHRTPVSLRTRGGCVASAARVSAQDLGRLGLGSVPHVLVFDESGRRPSGSLVCHVCSHDLPNGSFFRASPDFVVASPELCFVQMATMLSFPKLVRLGYELCGKYVLRPPNRRAYSNVAAGVPAQEGTVDLSKVRGFRSCTPLTSLDRLTGYIGQLDGIPGVTLARRALQYVAQGAESPAESEVAMLLSMPTRSGGSGFRRAEMGRGIKLPADLARMAGRQSFRPDLYWPDAKLCVEYNSRGFHSKEEEREWDAFRSNILSSLGVTVISVTPRQLFDIDRFDAIVRSVAKHLLGRTPRVRVPDYRNRQLTLRNELFDYSDMQ